MSAIERAAGDRTRRELFLIGCGSLVAAMAGFFVATLRFLIPNVLYEPSRRFVIGPPTDFPPAAATFLPARRVFIFNGPDGFYAISSVCTHLGCNVKRGGPGFECPCHGSRFDENGRVVHGPAPSSLAWYVLSLSPRRELVVDLDRQVGPEFRLRV
jgi:cytochrome b6-f complex iron-sulfur subunit